MIHIANMSEPKLENHPNLVSICIITKNEKMLLERCLKSFQNTGYDIVVIDTGSTDGTIKMVKNYTPYLYHFEWIDDFSAARNFAISKVASKYVMMVDSDETLKQWNKKTFEQLIKEHPIGVGYIRKENLLSEDGKDYTISDEPRMFPKNYYHYEVSIHEQIVPIFKGAAKKDYYHILFILDTSEHKKKRQKNKTKHRFIGN